MRKTFAIVFSAILLFAFAGIQIAMAQTQTPPTTPVPSSTPEIVSTLQSVVATQQVQIEEQNRILTHNVEDLARAEQDWQWKWGILGLLTGILGTIAASMGLNSIGGFKKQLQTIEKDFAKQIKQMEQSWATNLQTREVEWSLKSQQSLNKVLDKFDLAKLPIYVPKELAALRLSLEHRGLKPTEYENIENVPLNGVIVVRIDTEEDESKFKSFLDKFAPNPKRAAFLLYAVTKRVSTQVNEWYENLIISNFRASAITNILAIGRDLEIDETKKEHGL